MIEQIEKYLKCNEHFRNNIDKYKEIFIKYYGEEKREEVETAFSKAVFIAFQTPSTIEANIRSIQNLKTEEIIENSLPKDSTFSVEDIGNGSSFENINIMPINDYSEFLRLYEMSDEEKHREFVERGYAEMTKFLPQMTMAEFEEMLQTGQVSKKYDVIKSWVRGNLEYWIDPDRERILYEQKFDRAKPLLEKIDKDITLENFSYYADNPRVQELNDIAKKYPEMVQKYNEYMVRYKTIIEEIGNNRNRRQAINDKYYQELIKENEDLIPEDKRKGLQEYYASPDKSYLLDRFVSEVFGYSLINTGAMDSFTTASDEILRTSDQEWKLRNIKDARISYFKSQGVDLGDDYEAYENSEEARNVWPTNERADKLIESKNEMLNNANIEYYNGIEFYRQIRSEIDSHHLLDKEDSFNASLFTSPGSFVNPNIMKTKDGYDMFSLVVISCDTMDGTIDHNIIHELNHLYELSLAKVEGNEYEGYCGWDILEGEMNQTSVAKVNTLTKEKKKRPYELFNEIINEIIAQELCGVMREDGLYIFDTQEKAKDKYVTSYENTFFIVRDFYSEFKDKIIESRRGGNIQVIWDEVGKENFDALNDLFQVFYENFAGFKYYNLLDDLQSKADTPRTRIYFDIIAKRDAILEKMRSHNMLNEATDENAKSEEKSDGTTKK